MQSRYAPKGGQTWSLRVLRRLVESDIDLPRTYEEIAELVARETLARLDPVKNMASGGTTGRG